MAGARRSIQANRTEGGKQERCGAFSLRLSSMGQVGMSMANRQRSGDEQLL